MTPEEFTDAVREEARTPLSRLGSSKSLYADTMGEMDEESVLAAVLEAEHAAAATFERWADEEPDGETADVFRGVADAARERYQTVSDKLGNHDRGDQATGDQATGDHETDHGPAIQEYLRGLEDTIARLGGLVGHALVADEKTGQVIGFFTGQADPRTAGTFRDMTDDFDAQLDAATGRLDALCDSGEDWDRALEAATDAIQAAYDEYFERLEDMGVNPKPVC